MLPPETGRFPSGVQVIVRDWLNANHVLLTGSDGAVLVDTGYGACAAQTLDLLRRPEYLGRAPLARIVNTHGHSDHVGGNAALQRTYGCTIHVPAAEGPLIEAWDERGLWLSWADQYVERFRFDTLIEPDAVLRMGDLDWRAIFAPGHDMGAMVFYCEEARLLISGDALWEAGFGVILPDPDHRCLAATRRTLDLLSQLDPLMVIPGHGQPFTDYGAALERAYRRVESFEQEPARMGRHAMKVMLSFALMHRRRLPLAGLPEYLGSVPCYGELNRQSLNLPFDRLAEVLVGELERAGAVERRNGELFPR